MPLRKGHKTGTTGEERGRSAVREACYVPNPHSLASGCASSIPGSCAQARALHRQARGNRAHSRLAGKDLGVGPVPGSRAPGHVSAEAAGPARSQPRDRPRPAPALPSASPQRALPRMRAALGAAPGRWRRPPSPRACAEGGGAEPAAHAHRPP